MKYTKEILQEAVSASISIYGVMKLLDIKLTGGSHSHIKRKIDQYGIDRSHFLGQAHNRGKRSPKKRTAQEIFDWSPEYRLHHKELNWALTESGVERKCVKCGNIGEWFGERLALHIDHIDGNWQNNKRDNLRFLCPNCHSQTPTFCRGTTPKKPPKKCKKCEGETPSGRVFCSDECLTTFQINNKPTPQLENQSNNKPRKPKILKTCPQCELEHYGRSLYCCVACSRLGSRKAIRPPREELLRLVEDMGYCATARKFGVSDNAIRKWLK